jgi:HEAT repeat protein
MKRLLVVIGLLCCILATGFAATGAEDLEIYIFLYENSTNITDKHDIMAVLQARKLTGAGAFYAKALKSLVDQIPNIQRSGTAMEKAEADGLAQLLASVLGDEKYLSSAVDLSRAVYAFSSPLVKAEALISLGKIRDTAYLDAIIRVLSDLNAAPPRGKDDADAKSIIARGAIIALEKFRDEKGYLPIFIMSVGGYPERIKKLARDTLPIILEDPSELLTEQVIKSSSYAPDVKFVALQTIENATAPDTSKAAAAVAALSEGWRQTTNDQRQRGQIALMRKMCIDMIRRYGTTDAAVYPLLERSYKQGLDDKEKLDSIQCLGALATEDAAKLLNSSLIILVGKLQSGAMTRTDNEFIRAIIGAIGSVGSPSSRAPLRSLLALDAATNALKQLANDVLAKLPAQ